jgi:putative two-component system hydrogenase maturation factor HypX/HoxX
VLWRPDLVIAPFLKRAIPASIWTKHVCLVVHPGVTGDRGPSALDWAIQEGAAEWGVTVLQANAEMDGGDIWATRTFPVRAAKKSSLYRNEVTEAAVAAMLEALQRFPDFLAGRWQPLPLDYSNSSVRGRLRPLMRQQERAIDWQRDTTATVLRKINAADGVPGVHDALFGESCQLFDAQRIDGLRGQPGALLGRAGSAVLRATADGAISIGHVLRPQHARPFKLPAAVAFADAVAALPQIDGAPGSDIRYEEEGAVGYLHFDFYNGAMSSAQCAQLIAALHLACQRPTRVLVLMGGEDFWSNGIHLNLIEAADSPADESMRNIEAIDDLALEILMTTDRLLVAALQGNAGAGGCFLALAADQVWARRGVVLNPHYKNMGNLYGSEYWTYLLPRRVGAARARDITQRRLPLSASGALQEGLIDACFGDDLRRFRAEVRQRAGALASAPEHARRLADKQARRRADEAQKPLAAYRAQELAEMRRNFYGFDPSYHYARQHFVSKQPQAWTPRHLAPHRDTSARSAACGDVASDALRIRA